MSKVRNNVSGSKKARRIASDTEGGGGGGAARECFTTCKLVGVLPIADWMFPLSERAGHPRDVSALCD